MKTIQVLLKKIAVVLLVITVLATSGVILRPVGADSNTPNTWTSDPNDPTIGEGVTAATLGSSVHVLGGNISPCSHDVYDTATQSWSVGASPPECVVEPAGSAATGGLIYLISGICRGNPATTCAPETDTPALQIYNPTTNTWSVGANIPTPRSRAGVTVQNGKIFVIGGYFYSFGAVGPAKTVVEAYDIGTNTWTTQASMPTAREGLLAATVGDQIYAIGGLLVPRNTATPTGAVERYDVISNTWFTTCKDGVPCTPMPTPRGIVMGGVACGNSPIFVIGGVSTVATTTNEAFIPSHNSWISRAPLPGSRAEAGTGIVGAEIHIISGFTVSEGVGDNDLNQAYHCPSGVGGLATSSGMGVGGLLVSLSSGGGLLSSVLTGNTGFYYVDVPGPGSYTVSVTTITGTVSSTVNVPASTIIIQNLAT